MPRRSDLKTILLIGSGPIVIGQGCEFDYSGTQACKALKEEGYRIVLVNSNPATIMTDPAFSDRTYIEPITPATIRRIFEREARTGHRIDALLPTLGGQTALNCACALWDDGTLTEFGVEMIGASRDVIQRAEDRQAFKDICEGLGLRMPRARTVSTVEDGLSFAELVGMPVICRPAYTLGGTGGGIAYNAAELRDLLQRGLAASMIRQVQLDESVIGWKEYELEVVRDRKDNCVIVCGIENIDPMGVHTGDSITVAPILTLTDKEYQAMRDAAMAIMRAVGVETGGSNVQFAVNPNPAPGPDGTKPFEMVVVEMNPRVSRSSALASKATGFPIARIAAKLAIGYTLDELRNDITGTTSACFEPAIDYVVTKMPRWTFEKFPEADETLTTQMKSVGEAMAIGRTFKESFQKVIRSMDVKRFGFGLDRNDKWLTAMRAVETQQLVLDITPGVKPGTGSSPHGLRTADGQPIEWPIPIEKLTRKLAVPCQGRPYYIRYAFKMGWSVEKVHEVTRIDPFFLDQLKELVEFEDVLCDYPSLQAVPAEVLRRAKMLGYSDAQLANLYFGKISADTILAVRARRAEHGITPVYKLVDTCAAEFEASTPYYYSTYEEPYAVLTPSAAGQHARGNPSAPAALVAAPGDQNEAPARPHRRGPAVIILGGGPNRIGQGIEFDYCCCHAAFAARELGFTSVMVNCNPETVSTDFDTSDLLYFEPLTLEDVLNVIESLGWSAGAHAPDMAKLVQGVIVQFGGQTPLNLAHGLVKAGVPIIGTSVDSIDLAEDRDRFDELLGRLALQRPPAGIARSLDEAAAIAGEIGYPVLLRPSYVLGGRGMEICSDETALRHFMTSALRISDLEDAPVLIDKFLDHATEIDVDVIADVGPAGTVSRAEPFAPRALVCGIMEHIEEAGIHSGDSACALPPYSLDASTRMRIADLARALASELRVRGLMNLQLALKDGTIYVLEVNPRASRTVPFVSKATHVPWPALAAKVMMGRSLESLGVRELEPDGYFAVKESVFPFAKFPGVDVVLGPEMRSTGEVMGIDDAFPIAFAKSQMGAGTHLPTDPAKGGVFVSVNRSDREIIVEPMRTLLRLGFTVYATEGTAEYLSAHGLSPTVLQKIAAGARPNVIDLMANGKISLIVNTPTRTGWRTDEGRIRSTAVRLGIPMLTTATAAVAAARAIEALQRDGWGVAALQDYAGRQKPSVSTDRAPGPNFPDRRVPLTR